MFIRLDKISEGDKRQTDRIPLACTLHSGLDHTVKTVQHLRALFINSIHLQE